MWCAVAAAIAAPLPADSTQLIVARVAGVDASSATVQRWQRTEGAWKAVGEPMDARIGREGVAWGRGLHAAQPGQQKREGDWRAPAGVFALGNVYATAPLNPPPSWPLQVIDEHHLWVEDADSPLYNQHVVVPADQALSDWQRGQQMRLNDAAHRLKIAVHHNAAPQAVSGAGSAIFFHIWRRDGASPTAGCTALPAADLEALIHWMDPAATPLYVLLTEADYARLKTDWALP